MPSARGVFFGAHYMFASLTAHTTALLPVVLAAVVAVPDIPVAVLGLVFGAVYLVIVLTVELPYLFLLYR